MMDGISTMDTGNNGSLLQMNVESIAEVKVLTSSYQAEYGRSSGLQITAVTKSGTNRFRGSVYDVERSSDWNSNSRTNILNSDPKTVLRERDWGYSIGGPIGKPGGNNKLFFFYSHEYAPRTAATTSCATACRRRSSGRATSRRRTTTTATCSRTSRIRCCRAPAARRTRPRASATAASSARFRRTGCTRSGLNLLNIYPLPNIDGTGLGVQLRAHAADGEGPGLAAGDPGRLPAHRSAPRDRQVFGLQQRNQVFNGTLPGFNDAQQQDPVVSSLAMTVNYS